MIAFAIITINKIRTISSILARLRGAIIDINLAIAAGPPRLAITMIEGLVQLHANSIMFTRICIAGSAPRQCLASRTPKTRRTDAVVISPAVLHAGAPELARGIGAGRTCRIKNSKSRSHLKKKNLFPNGRI